MTGIIRLADEYDEFDIYKLLALAHEEQPIHPIDWSRVTAFVRLATRRNEHSRGVIGVIGPRYDLHAMVFLMMEQVWWSGDWELRELINFVHPDYRKTFYARDLIRYAIDTAEKLGLDLTIGVLSGIRTEGKCRLYRRMLPKFGEFFVHRPASLGKFPSKSFEPLAAATPANSMAAE